MKRKIIVIDEDKCVGCEACIKACHEGALQIVDGKARVIGNLLCDGLGACLDVCDFDALKIEELDVEPYDEDKVMEGLLLKGDATVLAHLKHLYDHKQYIWYNQGLDYLIKNKLNIPNGLEKVQISQSIESNSSSDDVERKSFISQWPIQLHLINPDNSIFIDSDFVLAADCAAFTHANFQNKFLKNKKIAIACPKLDDTNNYIEKLIHLIDHTKIKSLTVITMEVPCCGGLWYLANKALEQTSRKILLKREIIGVDGQLY